MQPADAEGTGEDTVDLPSLSAVGTSPAVDGQRAALGVVALRREAARCGLAVDAPAQQLLDASADLADGLLGAASPSAPQMEADLGRWAASLACGPGASARALMSALRESMRALSANLDEGIGAGLLGGGRGGAEVGRDLAHLVDRAQQTVPASDRSRYRFTTRWFNTPMAAWGPRSRHLRGQPFQALEVGTFEGASALFVVDELMTHPDSRLVVVDTFAGAMDHQPREGGPDYALDTLFARFAANLERSARQAQVETMRMSSREATVALRARGARFDFVYIDGSHTAADVLHDAVVIWPMVKVGGTVVFDDIDWQLYRQEIYNPGPGIEAFLRCHRHEVRVVKDTGQLWVTRVAVEETPVQLFEWDGV